jgi:hypothetical protein
MKGAKTPSAGRCPSHCASDATLYPVACPFYRSLSTIYNTIIFSAILKPIGRSNEGRAGGSRLPDFVGVLKRKG